MREIKFRGKRIDNGEWVEGCYAFSKIPLMDGIDHFIIVDGLKPYNVDPETVGQYTGLKDKNGKEIYEGDICRDSLGWVFVVEWDNDGSRFIGRHSKPRGDTYICYVGREPKVEVIGNRFDNPELLGEVRE